MLDSGLFNSTSKYFRSLETGNSDDKTPIGTMNDFRARLKRLCPTKRYSRFWDEDQWALLLSDFDETETIDEAGYVAIVPKNEDKWCVRFVIGGEWGHGLDTLNPIFDTPEKAKRYVGMLIGFDSGEIPLFGDSDPI